MKKYTEKRPWGMFEQFTKQEPVTVKIITVNPNESLSLQFHNKREEFWKMLSGAGDITLGDSIIPAREGDEFFIEKRQRHRIEAQDSGIKMLEISFGEFDENDIVRLEDKYNR
ncbi:MAG: phosphomannose isomerase type II C-terminal cupin domain [Candidatus Omnitrophota bacterium]